MTAPSRPGHVRRHNDHYQYSRFADPTLSTPEEWLRLIEGAEACRTTATGMAAVNAALLAHLKSGDRVVASRALFGSLLTGSSRRCCRNSASPPSSSIAPTSRNGARRCRDPRTRAAGDAVKPDARAGGSVRDRRSRACGGRDRGGGQCVRDTFAAAAAEVRGGRGGVFVHQAYRRSGACAWRRGAGQPQVDQRDAAAVHPQHRAGDVAVQCLGAAEGFRDVGVACGCCLPRCRDDRRVPRRTIGGDARLDPGRAPIILSRNWHCSR